MSQSKEGERMALTIMKGHLLPPIRAEPVVGEKQPVAQLKYYKIIRQRRYMEYEKDHMYRKIVWKWRAFYRSEICRKGMHSLL